MTGSRLTCQIFKTYLSDRKPFVSVNGNDSDLMPVDCGVAQGSFLGPPHFLICINDPHKTVQFCKVHYFADDKNLFHTTISL